MTVSMTRSGKGSGSIDRTEMFGPWSSPQRRVMVIAGLSSGPP